MREACEIPSSSTEEFLTPGLRCILCDVDLDTRLDKELHEATLRHHVRMDKDRGSGGETDVHHCCRPCKYNCNSLSEYSKHVDTEEHEKRIKRLTARIDTMDAGDNDTRQSKNMTKKRRVRCEGGQVPRNDRTYEEPRTFVRGTASRMTYPQKAPPLMEYSFPPPPMPPHQSTSRDSMNGYESHAMQYSRTHRPNLYENYYFKSGNYDRPWLDGEVGSWFASGRDEVWTGERNANEEAGGVLTRSQCQKQKSDDVVDGKKMPPTGESADKRKGEAPKRGILARLSMRAARFLKNSPSKKLRESKSGRNTPDSGIGSEGVPKADSARKSFIPAVPRTTQEYKKKWQKIGNLSKLRPSMRQQKKRNELFRLVGQDGKPTEEPVTESTTMQMATTSKSSHVWGTSYEDIQYAARKKAQQQEEQMMLERRHAFVMPETPPTLGSQSGRDEGMYASVAHMPMSTPSNLGVAFEAYDQNSADISKMLLEIQQTEQAVNELVPPQNSNTYDNQLRFQNNQGSTTSSLAMDDQTLSSRMDLTVMNPTKVIKIEAESCSPEDLPCFVNGEGVAEKKYENMFNELVGLMNEEEKKKTEVAEIQAQLKKAEADLLQIQARQKQIRSMQQ